MVRKTAGTTVVRRHPSGFRIPMLMLYLYRAGHRVCRVHPSARTRSGAGVLHHRLPLFLHGEPQTHQIGGQVKAAARHGPKSMLACVMDYTGPCRAGYPTWFRRDRANKDHGKQIPRMYTIYPFTGTREHFCRLPFTPTLTLSLLSRRMQASATCESKHTRRVSKEDPPPDLRRSTTMAAANQSCHVCTFTLQALPTPCSYRRSS